MTSRESFLDFTITEVWKLLDTMRQIREAWSSNLGDEGGIKIEHDCIKAFVATWQVDELDEKYHVDTNIVLHVLQAVAEKIKAPKKGWFGYGKPTGRPRKRKVECAYIDAPLGPVKERPPYEEPPPFPRTKRMHELAYEAQQHAKRAEEEKLASKIIEEAAKELEIIEEVKSLEERMFPNCKIVKMEEDTSKLIFGKIKSKEFGKPLLPCSFGGVSYYGLCDLDLL